MDLQVLLEQRAKVEEFQRKHRVGLLTLLFTDLVGSTKLKQELGDREAVALIQRHHALVREILGRFKEGEEIGTAGDSFFIVFTKPSDAAQFSLLLQNRLRREAQQTNRPLLDRIGIHIGEVVVEERQDSTKRKDLYGLQVDICARVMSLAEGDQILLTRSAFDNARQVLKGQDIEGVKGLSWLNHGPYVLKGVEEPLEICEVGEVEHAVLKPPPDSEKVHRYVSPDAEPVLGWRPALEQVVPGTQWVLEEKLGEGGFGEVWLGRHQVLKERRVFKFCFRADRVRPLKREITLFRLLKERVGEHPNVVKVHDVYLDEPPYYLAMEYVEGRDLKTWCEERGGVGSVPRAIRLEIVAQVAGALQAAHDAGIVHRDVKPSNILICQTSGGDSQLTAKLTDFGIGQVTSQEALAGLTKLGFTQTLAPAGSSTQIGTTIYMAPELLAGKPASAQSDIYALGVVLYQLLSGDFSRPLTIDWPREMEWAFVNLLTGCLAGDPEARLSVAQRLGEDLRSIKTHLPRLERKRKFAKVSLPVLQAVYYITGAFCTALGILFLFPVAPHLLHWTLDPLRSIRFALVPIVSIAIGGYFVYAAVTKDRFTLYSFAGIFLVALGLYGAVDACGVVLGRPLGELTLSVFRGVERTPRGILFGGLILLSWLSCSLGVRLLKFWHKLHLLVSKQRKELDDSYRGGWRSLMGSLLACVGIVGLLSQLKDDRGTLFLLITLGGLSLGGFLLWSGHRQHQNLQSLGHRRREEQQVRPTARAILSAVAIVAAFVTLVLYVAYPSPLKSINTLAQDYASQGKYAEAARLHAQVLEVRKRMRGPEHPQTLTSMNSLAAMYRAQRKYAEAERMHAEALEIQNRVLGAEHPSTLSSMNNLALVYENQGKLSEAERLLRETLQLHRNRTSPLPQDLSAVLASLGGVLLRQNKFGDAEPPLRECLELRQKSMLDDWRTFSARILVGRALLGQKRFEAAEPLLLEGYQWFKEREQRGPSYGRGYLREAGQRLVQLYEAWGKPEKAEEWKAKLKTN